MDPNLRRDAPRFARPSDLPPPVSPRTEFEVYLTRLWAQEIGVTALGVDDSFFDLGGDSLAAEAIFSAIEEEIGVSLPTAVLLEHATIAELARRVQDGAGSCYGPVLVLRPHGSRPPFFCVDAAGGGLLTGRQLIAACPPDQPVFGLARHRYESDTSREVTIEGLARQYVELVRRVCPEGPYYLGGFCAAGVISLEMARQLEELGGRVELVLMLDTTNRHYYTAWRRAALHIRRAALDRDAASYERIKGQIRGRLAELLARPLRTHVVASQKQPSSGTSARRAYRQILRRALQRYVPGPCRGRVTLIASSSYRRLYARPDLGWAEVVPHLSVVEIDGTHAEAVRGSGLHALSQVLQQAQGIA